MNVSDEEWRRRLTPEQYKILREKGTEVPGTGSLLHNTDTGKYVCAACGAELFDSNVKFDSKSGWPSFYDAKPGSVNLTADDSLGMARVEATCAVCGSHLGHVFDDAYDQPTGKRYCINSVALKFIAQASDTSTAQPKKNE